MSSIDRGSPIPLYFQLKQLLLSQIRNGELCPGDALASEHELSDMYGVSQITVRRTLRDLASEGHISRQPGRGTFISLKRVEHWSGEPGGLLENLAQKGLEMKVRVLDCRLMPAPSLASAKLQIGKGSLVTYLERLSYTAGEPLGILMDYYNLGVGRTLTDKDVESTPIYTLLQKLGIVLRRMERNIQATCALEHEAQLLEIKVGQPLLLVEIVGIDDQDKPIFYKKNLYRGDLYNYRHTIKLG